MEPDWVIHYILDNPLSFHTHGLDKYGSLEIEVVLPLYPEEGAAFCNCIGAAIVNGLKIEDGLMVDNLFTDGLGCRQPIYFFKTRPIQGSNPVYRAIFPDPNGLFPWEQINGVKCAEGYKDQIAFNQDMCFFIVIEDTARVEEYGTEFGSIFYKYEKRDGCYIRPVQYYVADIKDVLLTGGEDVFDIRRTVQRLKGVLYGVENAKVVCKPVDYSDSIHKGFIEYKERYLKNG